MTPTLPRTDRQLTAAILDKLALTPNVTADRIGVYLTDGAVTLSGRVRTYPEKEAAVRATMRVLGVTAIADEIIT